MYLLLVYHIVIYSLPLFVLCSSNAVADARLPSRCLLKGKNVSLNTVHASLIILMSTARTGGSVDLTRETPNETGFHTNENEMYVNDS